MLTDPLDRSLLSHLQDDGRMTNAALAERVGLSEAPCWRRVKRLEQEGVIKGYRADLDPRALGLGVTAFVSVKFSQHSLATANEFESAMASEPRVLSCHNVTGEMDYLLEVAAKDLDDYYSFTVLLRGAPGVSSIQSSLSLREVKRSGKLPL